jgi:hypothetical protein
MADHNEVDRKEWAALLNAGTEAPAVTPEFQQRLIADFDALMRARRAGPLTAFADAFGWPALARPFAPAALGAAMVALGGFTGAVTASGGAGSADDAYSYLAAGLDPAGDFGAEVAAWAEQ